MSSTGMRRDDLQDFCVPIHSDKYLTTSLVGFLHITLTIEESATGSLGLPMTISQLTFEEHTCFEGFPNPILFSTNAGWNWNKLRLVHQHGVFPGVDCL